MYFSIKQPLTQISFFSAYSAFSAAKKRKLALFGFVFLEPEGDFIFIILCEIEGCIHFVVGEIGFVLHKSYVVFRMSQNRLLKVPDSVV